MKKTLAVPAWAFVALAALLVVWPPLMGHAAAPPQSHVLLGPLNGSPVYLGRIDATGASETNAQASATFNTAEGNRLEGKVLLVETDADCDFKPVAASNTVITAANSPSILAGVPKVFAVAQGLHYLAAVGTCNLDVWELK